MGSYLQVNLLAPGSCLVKKKNLPGRGLTKVEKHYPKGRLTLFLVTSVHCPRLDDYDKLIRRNGVAGNFLRTFFYTN